MTLSHWRFLSLNYALNHRGQKKKKKRQVQGLYGQWVAPSKPEINEEIAIHHQSIHYNQPMGRCPGIHRAYGWGSWACLSLPSLAGMAVFLPCFLKLLHEQSPVLSFMSNQEAMGSLPGTVTGCKWMTLPSQKVIVIPSIKMSCVLIKQQTMPETLHK